MIQNPFLSSKDYLSLAIITQDALLELFTNVLKMNFENFFVSF